MAYPTYFDTEALLACSRGELFGPATPSFPHRPC